MMRKGTIFYTDNELDGTRISRLSQESIAASGLPVVSCSLKPIDFGRNIVLEGLERGYYAMVLQIVAALEASDCEQVFFAEHDVLYSPTHWDLNIERQDIFYYNVNNWRWPYGEDWAITYSGLTSLSMMTCSRDLALNHYRKRRDHIDRFCLFEDRSREPKWGRRLGYEPGTKRRRRGGFSDDEHIKVRSEFPNIDIRHSRTFSAPKVRLEDFKHKPEDFVQAPIDEIPGWDLRELFGL